MDFGFLAELQKLMSMSLCLGMRHLCVRMRWLVSRMEIDPFFASHDQQQDVGTGINHKEDRKPLENRGMSCF